MKAKRVLANRLVMVYAHAGDILTVPSHMLGTDWTPRRFQDWIASYKGGEVQLHANKRMTYSCWIAIEYNAPDNNEWGEIAP